MYSLAAAIFTQASVQTKHTREKEYLWCRPLRKAGSRWQRCQLSGRSRLVTQPLAG